MANTYDCIVDKLDETGHVNTVVILPYTDGINAKYSVQRLPLYGKRVELIDVNLSQPELLKESQDESPQITYIEQLRLFRDSLMPNDLLPLSSFSRVFFNDLWYLDIESTQPFHLHEVPSNMT